MATVLLGSHDPFGAAALRGVLEHLGHAVISAGIPADLPAALHGVSLVVLRASEHSNEDLLMCWRTAALHPPLVLVVGQEPTMAEELRRTGVAQVVFLPAHSAPRKFAELVDSLLGATGPVRSQPPGSSGDASAGHSAQETERLRHRLTGREYEVWALLGRGYSNQQIADELTIGLTTAINHVANVRSKLAVKSRHEAAHLFWDECAAESADIGRRPEGARQDSKQSLKPCV